jgi:hypothetical protein
VTRTGKETCNGAIPKAFWIKTAALSAAAAAEKT